jgi:hypothetical protein
MRRLSIFLFPIIFLLTSCASPVYPVSKVNESCLSVQSDISTAPEFSGTLILGNGETFSFENHILVHKQIFPVETNKYQIIISDIYYSPDRQKIISSIGYFTKKPLTYDSDHLFLLNTGNVEKEIYGWNDLGQLLGWFDNEWLLYNPIVELSEEMNLKSPSDRPPGTIFLFNPITMEKRKIIPTISDFYTLYPLPSWYKSLNPLPLYNSTLDKVFYLSDHNRMVYSLRDVHSMQLLWSREVGDPYSKPQWSPDNKHVVVALRKKLSNPHQVELFSIDLQGKETQLTNISKDYDNVYIGIFQWSPNGERIAFWFNYSMVVDDSFQPRVAVLDIKHGTINDYCIESNGGDIIWSPDGHQIAFLHPQYSNPGDIIILDIEKHQATIIGKSKLFPVAWIK